MTIPTHAVDWDVKNETKPNGHSIFFAVYSMGTKWVAKGLCFSCRHGRLMPRPISLLMGAHVCYVIQDRTSENNFRKPVTDVIMFPTSNQSGRNQHNVVYPLSC